MNERTPLLKVEALRIAFGGHEVLSGVNLAIERGTVLGLVGKSGAGKSVLLRSLAGLLTADSGALHFDGVPLADAEARTRLRKRCSYLFQGNALMDSLTVLENVTLPLEQTTRLDDREIHRQALTALENFELSGCGALYPAQLSGGQQKRLALARALVTRPDLVMFDEPTAGLDPVRRNDVFELIVETRLTFGFTAVIVTHDIPEALAACDRIAFLGDGRIRFDGAPEDFARATGPDFEGFQDGVLCLKRRLEAIRARAAANSSGPDEYLTP